MYKKIKKYFINILSIKFPYILDIVHKYKRGIKYVISGGTSAFSALVTVYVVTDILNVWYLISVIFGQVIGFFVNFYLQKFWTFRDKSKQRMERQFKLFIGLSVVHTILNAIFIFILVEFFGIWYLLAQAIVLAVLATGSYLFNRFITFKAVSSKYESTKPLS